jgi:glyoxalase superfamily protein
LGRLAAVPRLHDIVFDCAHPAALARFWAAAVDGYAVAPYDDAERERLRAQGVDDPEDDPTVLVEGPPGAPRLWFQRVPEPKVVKNRVHLDLCIGAVDAVDAELDRLVGLGATVLGRDVGKPGWMILADPEGNEFCVSS